MLTRSATALIGSLLLLASLAPAAPAADRFLHVQVAQGSKGDSVNVNLPLSVAEKVLPTIDKGPLHQGRVTVPGNQLQGIDLRAMVDALRTAPDSQIVTAKDGTQDVSVEKSNGNFVVHVKDSKARGENVEVTVPIRVVDALLSSGRRDEFDVAAALQELDNAGDSLLVTVESASEHVRVWVDSHNGQ